MADAREPPGSAGLTVIGQRQPRLDGFDKVSGRAVFSDDIVLPGMLHGRILRSPHARARIVRIDTVRARALPGVKAVVTNADAPDMVFSERQPLLAKGEVHYVGEEVAAVAATDPLIAEAALDLIDVEYAPLPAITSLRKAMQPGAEQLHPWAPGNVAATHEREFGDPDAAFAASDLVITDEFTSPVQHNTLAEFHVAIADFSNPDRLHVWTPTQSAPMYKLALAKAFGLAESQVRIVYGHIGGAFTGRGRAKPHHFIAALLSRMAARPVKIKATGDEEFIRFRGSGETRYRFRTGVTRDGRIRGLELDVSFDAGAHAEWAMILWLPAAYPNWLYHFDGLRYRGRFIYTNTVPKGSHHGGIFGRLSAGWMQHLTHVAEELGMDPAAFHRLNAIDPGHHARDGSDFASCGLKECIDRVVERSGWKDKYGRLPPYRGIGIGIGAQASGGKNASNDTSAAMLKVAEDGKVTLYTGIPDIGQGAWTVMAMIAAEVLGVAATDVDVVGGDSDIAPFDWGAFSQRGTFMTGNAVKAAAEDARAQLATVVAATWGVAADSVVFARGRVHVRGEAPDAPGRSMGFREAVARAFHGGEGRYVMGRGFFNSPRQSGSMAFSFGAQVAEVEVDPESGAVRVLKVTAAHDLGRALNPLAVEGQLDGQVFSGLSQVLYEECRMDAGQILNPSRLEYKLPRTYELPEVEYILVETVDPYGPFGAKEVGEGPIVVTMAAVANAVANALGEPIPQMPMTPWRLLRVIRHRQRRARAGATG